MPLIDLLAKEQPNGKANFRAGFAFLDDATDEKRRRIELVKPWMRRPILPKKRSSRLSKSSS
jgi:hypothetical protein